MTEHSGSSLFRKARFEESSLDRALGKIAWSRPSIPEYLKGPLYCGEWDVKSRPGRAGGIEGIKELLRVDERFDEVSPDSRRAESSDNNTEQLLFTRIDEHGMIRFVHVTSAGSSRTVLTTEEPMTNDRTLYNPSAEAVVFPYGAVATGMEFLR